MNQAVSPVASVDRTFLLIFGVSAVILALITAAMIYFLFRYNRKRHPVAADIDGNLWAETIWIAVPTLIVLAMFHYGWRSYLALREAPADAMTVKVTARMWSWSFEYPNGRKSETLVVPVGRPIKLDLTSVDVLHGFYVPAFRVKVDTVPGMTTHAWFLPQKEALHDIFCSVYCGVRHAKMISQVRAVPPEEFDEWLQGGTAGAAAREDAAVAEREGCLGCHSIDGSMLVGPSFKGLFGGKTTIIENGRERVVVVDRANVLDVLADPTKRPIKGFDPIMPPYPHLSQADRDALVRYLESLGAGGSR